MPLHDYRCTACGSVFEALVKLGNPAPACPSCGAAGADRLVSKPAAPGKSKAIVAAARKQAAREGHFSHYSAAERSRI